METLIIQVDCRDETGEVSRQLGITVEDPNRDARQQKKQQLQQRQQQLQQKDYHSHDYQNLDSDTFKQQGHRGLRITKIHEGDVIDRNGQFKVGDIIVEVNGVNLQRPFTEAQTTLKQFVTKHTSHGPLILKVLRKPAAPSPPPLQQPQQQQQQQQQQLPQSQQAQPPQIPHSTSSPSSLARTSRHLVGELNTRKIGVKHRIKLTKAANGFGIKIAQRDNMHSTKNRPIYITAITIAGSAYQDGRLKEGDMLLEVNGQDLQGKTQPEVTKMLKSIKTNEEVEFVISRQEDGIYTFDIPLNDTKSAGLGLYLKYPCRADDRKDLGIWIEKVITGGAAWKDGRLQPDDQILAINGIDIVNLSNAEASETLKKAAVCRGIGPEAALNTIRLRIHRRTPPVVAKILQGTNNRIECSDIITNGKSPTINEQNIDNPRVSCQTTFEDTLPGKTSETSSSNGSSNQNSQNDSAMSPQTQASNSLKLTNSRNDRSDQSSCDKTNETTSSAISQITDSINNVPANGFQESDKATSQSWDDESVDATNYEDCFQRDGFGRQSISEKRHAQLNAKNTDTFRRNQRLRGEREQHNEYHREVLVDLPVPFQSRNTNEIVSQNDMRADLIVSSAGSVRIAQNHDVNESFRASVDRSYEVSTNGSSSRHDPPDISDHHQLCMLSETTKVKSKSKSVLGELKRLMRRIKETSKTGSNGAYHDGLDRKQTKEERAESAHGESIKQQNKTQSNNNRPHASSHINAQQHTHQYQQQQELLEQQEQQELLKQQQQLQQMIIRQQQQQIMVRQQQQQQIVMQQQNIMQQHRQSMDPNLTLGRQTSKQAIITNNHPQVKHQSIIQPQNQQPIKYISNHDPMIGQYIPPHIAGMPQHMISQSITHVQQQQQNNPRLHPQQQFGVPHQHLSMHNYGTTQIGPIDITVPSQTYFSGQPQPQPIHQPPRRVFRAMYDYVANDIDEVSFFENDILVDCVNVDRNWLVGKVARSGQTGMLPANYVAELPSQ